MQVSVQKIGLEKPAKTEVSCITPWTYSPPDLSWSYDKTWCHAQEGSRPPRDPRDSSLGPSPAPLPAEQSRIKHGARSQGTLARGTPTQPLTARKEPDGEKTEGKGFSAHRNLPLGGWSGGRRGWNSPPAPTAASLSRLLLDPGLSVKTTRCLETREQRREAVTVLSARHAVQEPLVR